jgi:hypothetical protein
MKKIIRLFLIVFFALTLITSILSIQNSNTSETQDYAARVPLPIPPPPKAEY